MRREGLYSSLLTEWRRARDRGALGALEPRQRGPKPPSADRVQLARVQRELERSRADLATARRVIEAQGNVSAHLEELVAKSARPNERAAAHVMIDEAVIEIEPLIGTLPACRAIGASRATLYRRRFPPAPRVRRPQPAPARTLGDDERAAVLEALHSERLPEHQVIHSRVSGSRRLPEGRTTTKLIPLRPAALAGGAFALAVTRLARLFVPTRRERAPLTTRR